MSTITFYTRKNCSLCNDALTALETVRGSHPFELKILDLDGEAAADKLARYTDEVPVVELDGRKIMKFRRLPQHSTMRWTCWTMHLADLFRPKRRMASQSRKMVHLSCQDCNGHRLRLAND